MIRGKYADGFGNNETLNLSTTLLLCQCVFKVQNAANIISKKGKVDMLIIYQENLYAEH